MKAITSTLLFLLLVGSAAAEIAPRTEAMAIGDDDVAKIQWTDFEGAIDKNAKDKKLIFIDIYTGWCGWCKKMDQTTFVEPEVVEYMNKHFYAVKMDAETKDAIAFREVLYEHKMFNGKGYNELAVNLLGGKMSFPTFVILSKREVKIATINGYKNKSDLMVILKKYAKK